MHKSLLNSFVLVLLSAAVLLGQTGLSVGRVTVDSQAITGTCTDGAPVKIVAFRGAQQLPLPDSTCTGGNFQASAVFLKLQPADVIRIEQTSGGTTTRVSLTVPAPIITPPSLSPSPAEGDALIEGTCADGSKVTAVVSRENTEQATLRTETCASSRYKISVASLQLKARDTISVSQVLDGSKSLAFTATVEAAPRREVPPGDEREDFEASAYIGFAIDSFAAEEINRYLNPEANGKTKERGIFGFDFGYRLFQSETKPFQIWVFGETDHGARSDDVDCGKNPDFPTCLDASADFLALGKAVPKNALYMLRNATSLEAFTGFRVESKPINASGKHPAVLYGKVQAGFLNVAGSDGDAKDMHHFGFGALVVGGPLRGSYLEVGHGRTDLFATNRYKRFKIDGHLQYRISDHFSFFAQLFSDVDAGKGADAMQSYFGLSFDLGELFKPKVTGGGN
jgi:hypothetical protein